MVALGVAAARSPRKGGGREKLMRLIHEWLEDTYAMATRTDERRAGDDAGFRDAFCMFVILVVG